MLLDVTHVTVKPDFTLFLEFENGERRRFDMAAYIDQKPWVRLKSGNAFQGAFVENGTENNRGQTTVYLGFDPCPSASEQLRHP